MKDLISILLPVKNAVNYLEACLDSILKQDYQNWELISVNDHSTDDSFQILQTFANRDSRIKAFPNLGKGIIPALQLAFKNSKGSYITRMDADDIMPTDKLSVLHAMLQANDVQLAVGSVSYFAETPIGQGYKNYQDWLNKLTSRNLNFSNIYKECSIPSPCWMTSKTSLVQCGAFDSNRYPEDYDLAFRFYQQNLKLGGTKKILHHWRDHGSRASRNDPNYADNRFLEIKMHYFLKLDYNKEKQLCIWGAGKKGKQVAKILKANAVDFYWICNNDKKIGKDFSGTIMQSTAALTSFQNTDFIICVAQPDEQKEIKTSLNRQMDIDPKTRVFWFC